MPNQEQQQQQNRDGQKIQGKDKAQRPSKPLGA